MALGMVICLGAVAYAAAPNGSAGSAPDPGRSRGAVSLPRPSIVKHPDKLAVTTSAQFGFSGRGRGLGFECRLDGDAWTPCRSPVTYSKLATGHHRFSVRSAGRRGGHGRRARFRWRVLEPKDFAIEPQLSSLGAMHPGAPPQALPLSISNPNPVPIYITSLRVAATADPLGCPSADNLQLTSSSASHSAPIRVPAGGSVSLPRPDASPPTIQLRDLPVNQDACQGARFPLAFSGKARG